MITANAISSIEWLFEKSVRENSCVGPEDNCIVTSLPELASSTKPENRKLVVLNISSFIFRIVALIEFDSNPSTTAHLAKILRSPDMRLEGQTLLDAYAEFVNMICGAVNRRLSAELRHVGMSTPFVLDSASAGYLPMLRPTKTKSFEVAVNETNFFKLTLCICVADDNSLNLNIDQSDKSDQEDHSTGELELF